MHQSRERESNSGLQAPRVSVVIPSYNHAQYLGEAIQTALNQTYRDFEIIVVDDGSTDNTPQVLASFGDGVRCIRQENRGLSAARNAGILAAKGVFVGFLDADDMWAPNFLQVLVPILDHDERIGAAYSGSQFVDSRGDRLPQTITRTYPADQLYDVLTGGEFFPPSAVLTRRSVFQEIGAFDESLRASEDWDMWLRVSAQFLFAGVPNILTFYRIHGNNMSRDLDRMLENQLRVASKLFGPSEGNPIYWPSARQRAYAGVYMWQAVAHYQRNEPDLGAEYVCRTLATYSGVARSLDTFYMLLCAEQPSGHSGDPKNLDLKRNATRVLTTLDMIFADTKIPIGLRSNRRLAYGMTYFALGILAYGQRNLGQARKYLVLAVMHRLALAVNRQWALTFAKTLLGRRLLNIMLDWKHAGVISN